MGDYFRYTRSPYYSVVAALPLLLAYELLLLALGGMGTVEVRNAADVWMRQVLASFHLDHREATATMILLLLVAIPLVRDPAIRLVPRFFAIMFLEAVFYGLALRFAINFILVFIFSLFPAPAPVAVLDGAWAGPALTLSAAALPALALPPGTGFWGAVALSLGAGLFEEFFFRVILLTALLGATRVFLARWLSAVVSVLAAAFLFALAHYVGSLGEPFALHSFLFRWVAGLLFTVLYYRRGFAVTAYSHACYDIWLLVW